MLLYLFKGHVHFSLGSERIPQVKALVKEYDDKTLQHILRYYYHAYGRHEKNPYVLVPPIERRKSVIIDMNLFPDKRGKNEDFYLDLEKWPAVDKFHKKFMELHYSQNEKNLIIIREKIEKYQTLLAAPDATASEEKEADSMLQLFSKRATELEDEILKDEEFGINQPPAMHLFELPEDVKKEYDKMGFTF